MAGSYLVTWRIDIEDTADNPTEAAVQAMLAQRAAESWATVFEVTDKATGQTTVVDIGDDY